MKEYNTVKEYTQDAKENDLVVFGGKGIINGLNELNKHSTYKIVEVTKDKELIFKVYRGKTRLKMYADHYDQKMLLLNKKEFNKLETLTSP